MRKNFGGKSIAVFLWALFAAAIALFAIQIMAGPSTVKLVTFRIFDVDIPLALRIDPLSTVMLAMVSLLAAVIGQYALRYLDGSATQWRFHKYLLMTVAAVVCLVLSSNLVMFVAAWLAISWALHHLLLLHPDRPGAVYAARKKFLVSRLGDAAIIGAVALIYRVFGTFDFGELFSAAASAAANLPSAEQTLLSAAAVLLAAGAMTKSAQIPFHFWLPETMETPTPVSALMHAGIINAGGFLVIRLSPLVDHSQVASGSLAIIGSLTAVYGALVMATQSDIKSKLAYSTISQMGMMMFACGIHAYTFAIFHIIAHSFYKAHAFLSTASLVDERRLVALPPAPLRGPATLAVVAFAYGLIVFGDHWQGGAHLPALTYTAVLLIGLSKNAGLGERWSGGSLSVQARVCMTLILAVAVYVLIELGLQRLLDMETTGRTNVLVNSLAFLIFAIGWLVASMLVEQRSRLSQRIYMWLWNGGYVGAATTRPLSRIWPA